jgi:hypothetical protein
MDPIVLAAFQDELESMDKEAVFETLRVGAKALKHSLFGGTKLTAAPGSLHPQRLAAVSSGETLMKGLQGQGVNVHRARVKTPASLQSGGHVASPDDLLGMQMYGKGPKDVARIQDALKAQGVSISGSIPVVRPGYHGVNIKGNYQGTPMEMQVSPSRRSYMGSLMEHALAYKPKTEAPLSNAFDRWVGKRVAPKMVSAKSWVPEYAAG